ncbi:MAG: HD-GYP domain-containing protein [Defluviitaleaceae bacterium]|nr:HD-GYP domain-containing protein [Defluviitaleaceae bacterium]MCL2837348.1 HD-GYP domain-containing protein [Defluviitaleaceae bacterium]
MQPDQKSARRIAMENLKPGMVLARDLLDPDKNVVLPRHTALNKDNFNLIMLNANQYVYILEDSIQADRPSFLALEVDAAEHIIPADIPVQERETFKSFTAAYVTKPAELAKEFKRISEGGRINQDTLYNYADSIMGKLKTKSDILVYMNHMKATDEHVHTHSVNVALLANLFGIWINADSKELEALTVSALLHDIGMTQIDSQIVNKQGSLTREEHETLKKHTTLGYRLLDGADMPNEVKLAALGHHEKMNGGGYPLGIKGDRISKFSRIIHICDVYEAMTAERSYRTRICPFDVIKTFERGSYGVFDTEALLIFLQNIAYTYLNSRVQLSNGALGQVVFINNHNLSCPIIKTDDGRIIDLHTTKDLKVMQLV